MSYHFRNASSVVLAVVLCTQQVRGLAAGPPRVDLSANVGGVITGFTDVEANYWATHHLTIGLVVGGYGKGLLRAWDIEDFSGRAAGGRVNWVFAGDCRMFCWTAGARYLHLNRLQETDLSLPNGTYVHYSADNYFAGFGGTRLHDHLILKFLVGPDYWHNPKDIPAPQSSNPSKALDAVNHGLGIDAEFLVGVNF